MLQSGGQNLWRMFNSAKWSTVFRMANRRCIQTTARRQGGNGGHHAEQHGSSNKKTFLDQVLYPDNPALERRGYVYRETGNLQGTTQTRIARFGVICAWWFIFYNLWEHPENVFGHEPYPDTSVWTDAELGIPPDDAE